MHPNSAIALEWAERDEPKSKSRQEIFRFGVNQPVPIWDGPNFSTYTPPGNDYAYFECAPYPEKWHSPQFTFSDTNPEKGVIQKWMWQAYGKYLPHSPQGYNARCGDMVVSEEYLRSMVNRFEEKKKPRSMPMSKFIAQRQIGTKPRSIKIWNEESGMIEDVIHL